ncbi:MAG: hypothetical protein MUC96_35550 [Myxococcaceae bacterium]|jgi:hypothetical protein|nr:hypothetical protein [Myxococcaceae bacterium]
MILDNQLLFSENQSIAAAAGNVVSTNSFDNRAAQVAPGGFGTIRRDLFRGGMLRILIQLINAVTSGGAATVTFQLVQADNEALTTNVEVLASTRAFTLAELTAGRRIGLELPSSGLTRRWFGLRYVIATATTTGGTVTAAIVDTLDTGNAVADTL